MPGKKPANKRNYKREYAKFQSSTKAKKDRAARNKARREAERAGKVRKGDGKEVDHIKPLSRGGGNGRKNRRVVSRKTNRRKGAK